MDWINSIFAQYNLITKANPLVATLVLPIIGGLMFYLKDTPKRIWNTIVRYTTVTMSLNNAGWDGNLDAYNAFDKWFMQSGYKRFSRNFFMFRQYRDEIFTDEVYKPYRLGIGTGTHIFFYKKRLFWFIKGNLESSGSEKVKEEIKIRTLGWNHQVFEELIGLFNEKKMDTKHTNVHTYGGPEKGWSVSGKIINRDIETFCMNVELRTSIIAQIRDFMDRREWYRKKGLTYKLSYLFYGPPGTGKTTLSKLLASHFRRDIYILNLAALSDAMLVDALSKIKPGSFVLAEDVDEAGSAVKDRKAKNDNPNVIELASDMGGLTMSGVLNAFDGVIGLDNLIIIMTTNHLEKLDEAVVRSGRIDNKILIDNLTSVEISQYIEQMYDDPADERYIRALKLLAQNQLSVLGCDVEKAFKDNPDNPMCFLADVNGRHISRMPLPEAEEEAA